MLNTEYREMYPICIKSQMAQQSELLMSAFAKKPLAGILVYVVHF